MTKMVRTIATGLISAMMLGAPVVARASAATAPDVIGGKVKIVNFAFKPGTLKIPVGTKAKWTNKAVATSHTTTSDTALWDSGTLAPGQSFVFKFTKTGTFAYHCNIHPFMTAKIKVIP